MEIPVIIAHFGGSPNYLKLSLKSAAKFNSKVVLLGDESNKNSWKTSFNSELVNLDKYQDFLHSYFHMSDNSEIFELICFKRFFILEKWMIEEDIKEVLFLDSDVVTFADYSREIVPLLPNDCTAALLTSKNQDNFKWASSPHCSYWKIEALEAFTSFCIESYKNKIILDKLKIKYQWHLDNKKPGGICDMTLLYLWSDKNSLQVFNLAKVINDKVVDNNINDSSNYLANEYEIRSGFKKIFFENGIPYGYNKVFKKEIKFLCIHCQGSSKPLMMFLSHDKLKNFYSEIYQLRKFIKATLVALKFLPKK